MIPVFLNQCQLRDKFGESRSARVIYLRRGAAGGGHTPHNSEKAVVKLSGVLFGLVILLTLTLVARAQGVGDAQRGAQVFAQCKVCHSLEGERTWMAPAYTALSGARQAACLATLTRQP